MEEEFPKLKFRGKGHEVIDTCVVSVSLSIRKNMCLKKKLNKYNQLEIESYSHPYNDLRHWKLRA